MAPATRNAKTPASALEHVLMTVLSAPADSPLRYAMTAAGALDILDFMGLTKNDLTSLSWRSGAGETATTM